MPFERDGIARSSRAFSTQPRLALKLRANISAISILVVGAISILFSTQPVDAAWATFNASTGKLEVVLHDVGDICEIGKGRGTSGGFYLSIIGTNDGDDWGENRQIYTDDVHEIRISGGAGQDTIHLGAIDTNPNEWSIALDGNITIYGDLGNDTITGSKRGDVIYGGAGTDDIDGNGGSDKIGDTLWVDGSLGDDTNKGSLQSSPFATIQRAADVATTGADINIKGNQTYVEEVKFVGLVGSANDPIVITSHGGTATVSGILVEWPNNHDTNLPDSAGWAFTT